MALTVAYAILFPSSIRQLVSYIFNIPVFIPNLFE